VLPSDNWHWIANPVPTAITILFYVWISCCSLAMLFFLWLYYLKSKKEELKQKQFLLLALGFTIPVIGGIIMEVIFPLILQLNDVPITDSLVTVFSITSLIAISKYRMFDYSPKHQWNEIIESISEGIVIVNHNHQIMYVNNAFCELTGYHSAELKGTSAGNLIETVFGETKNRLNENSIRSNDKSITCEVKVKSKNESFSWMLMSSTPYKDPKQEIIGSIWLLTNITRIKSTELALKDTNAELELYIYKASHDLRGPLTSVLGLVDVWKTEIHDPISIEYMSMIERSARKLEYNLSELVKAMQIKETNFFNEIIDFEQLITSILTNYKNYPGFESMSFALNVNVKEVVFSNNFLLETIFQNLIENAIKYRNSQQEQSYLKITITGHSGKVIIEIEDNGIGIDSNSISKVFDMYYKGNSDPRGSGLGLYLVKKSIEKLKAQITLNSETGLGTSYKIVL
jgi:PAS domain S-box-containing protein